MLEDGKRAGPTADVYSLGMTAVAVVCNVALGPSTFRRTRPETMLREACDANLAAVLERAIAIDPRDRWQDMGAFREALEGAVRKPRPAKSDTGLVQPIDKSGQPVSSQTLLLFVFPFAAMLAVYGMFAMSGKLNHFIYLDEDGDGWGRQGTGRLRPADDGRMWVRARSYLGEVTWDCDDDDRALFPGAVQDALRIPGHCVDQIHLGRLFVPDDDGDGFTVDPSESRRAEMVPLGRAAPASYRPPSLRPDCDDRNHAIHPEAIETCHDNVDVDCDGDPDNGCPPDREPPPPRGPRAKALQQESRPARDSTGFWVDRDGDGYGAGEPVGPKIGGELPLHVPQAGDCDDTDPTTHVGAEERCDGKDNDCDGETDEGLDPKLWMLDDDNDGFGLNETSKFRCYLERPQNWTLTGGDCDDNLYTINPDGQEGQNDLDDDCDGFIDELIFVQRLTALGRPAAMTFEPHPSFATCPPELLYAEALRLNTACRFPDSVKDGDLVGWLTDTDRGTKAEVRLDTLVRSILGRPIELGFKVPPYAAWKKP